MHRFALHSPFSEWKPTDLPGNAHVSLTLGTYSMAGETVLLTSNLMTDGEIDYAVDGLVKELEEFRKKAKAELKKQNERIRAAVAARTKSPE